MGNTLTGWSRSPDHRKTERIRSASHDDVGGQRALRKLGEAVVNCGLGTRLQGVLLDIRHYAHDFTWQGPPLPSAPAAHFPRARTVVPWFD